MATTATLQSGQLTANPRIFSILQGSMKISQELKEILDSATEAFCRKSYKAAARYYNAALESWNTKVEKRQNQLIILTKYMLCTCWLESTDAKDLLDSLRSLKELEKNYGYEYPMLYYAVGKAYFKLYRFNEADEILKKGFSVLNGDIHVHEFNIPGTDIVIPESSRERLVAALVTLNEQCSSWHRSDAVCCMPDCSNHSQHEGIDKHIFFESPTFNGIVQVSCNNPNVCIMNFHSACWKAKKEQLCSLGTLGKMSDKALLNWECFTPNCEHQGIRCTIKKIEIFDENAESKAVNEARPDDVRHAKPNPALKGAIRKQQTPKVKVPSADCRAAPYERPVRPHSVPNNIPTYNNTHRAKLEDNEDDEDVHDEQALKKSIEKLQELRAKNFGIKDDAIWRPDLQMYGNEYMLSTANLIPDPDFGDSGVEEADLKAFFFSYFFEFISENGPVKLDILNKKWMEEKDMHVNSDAVLKHYLDISEFLLQSVKFAVIGNYICVAGKLPEAYELVKKDTWEIVRFFMENDIDQHSNSSSIGVLADDELIVEETTDFSTASAKIHKKNNKECINDFKATQATAPTPPSTPKTAKTALSTSTSNNQENGKITAPEFVGASKTTDEKNVIIPNPNNKREKRSYSPDYPAPTDLDEKSEPNVKKVTENRNESFTQTINEIHERHEKEEFLLSPLKASLSFEKLTKPIKHKLNLTKECKSTDDLRAPVAFVADNHKVLMNNSGELGDAFPAKQSFLTPRQRIEANPSKSYYENVSDSDEEYEGKTLLLESEHECDKKKLAATRVRMLQSSLQCQYAWNHSKIMMKIEECRRNGEICAYIQTMVKESTGFNMPNYESNWNRVMDKLKTVLNNHEEKFDELNEQLFSTKDPAMLEEFILESDPLPDMPPFELTSVIQAAFNIYRMQTTNESHRLSPAPAIRPPLSQPVNNLQHWQPNTDFYAGPQLVQGNSVLGHQQNYMPNLLPIPQHNSANSAAPHLQLFRNVTTSSLNFPYFSPMSTQYLPVNSAMDQMHQISSGLVQQQVLNAPQQKFSAVQRNSSSTHQIISPVHEIIRPRSQSAPRNVAGPENPKLKPSVQIPSSLAMSQNFCNLTQQNGQFFEKELTKGPSSFVTPELSTNSSTFNGIEKNPEQLTAENSQQAICVPEIPKISRTRKKAISTRQKDFFGQENMENGEVSKICVEKFEQMDLNRKDQPTIDPENNGAKKTKQNFNGNILQASTIFRPGYRIIAQEDIDLHATENTPDYDSSAKYEIVLGDYDKREEIAAVDKALKVAPNKAKARKKSEHSMDKLMKRLRKQYTGILELDLLKGVEMVRNLHNNSLSGIPISEIIREADRYILERQQKQLCGYVKRIPTPYFAASNAADRSPSIPTAEATGKQQTSVSSTSSASSLKKEQQYSSSSKKKWEPVVTPNDGWKKETPEYDCTICFESMVDTVSCTLQCQHMFHKTCIKNWYRHNQSCPTCRVHSTIDDEYPPLPLG